MPIFQPSAGPVPYSILDVFTSKRYAGNPLAVVDTAGSAGLDEQQRHQIAKEFNLSETVFVGGPEQGEEGLVWEIHIHTVERELPFAGHPTIGAACYLVSRRLGGQKPEGAVQASLLVPAGCIEISYFPQDHMATATIPHNYHQHASPFDQATLRKVQPALRSPPEASPIVSIVKGMTFALIELDDLDELGRVQAHAVHPDLDLDEDWATAGHIGVYYFVRLEDAADGTHRVRTRMLDFGTSGEDPATGSAACTLTAFLSLQGAAASETRRYKLTQGVEMGRTSDIGVEIRVGADGRLEEVRLAGTVVNVMSGELIAPTAVS